MVFIIFPLKFKHTRNYSIHISHKQFHFQHSFLFNLVINIIKFTILIDCHKAFSRQISVKKMEIRLPSKIKIFHNIPSSSKFCILLLKFNILISLSYIYLQN